MAIQKLVDYIHECKKKGVQPSKVKELLLEAGWAAYEVEEAFKESIESVEEEIVEAVEGRNTKNKQHYKLPYKWAVPAVIAVIALILVFSLTGRKTPVEQSPMANLKLCEANTDCLIQAAGRCEPSIGFVDVPMAAGNTTVDQTLKVEVIGAETSGCRVMFSVVQAKLNNPDMDEATKEQYKHEVAPPSSCLFLPEPLVQMLNKWAQDSASVKDYEAGECAIQEPGKSGCELATLSPYVDLPLKGKTKLSVTGFQGNPNSVSWRSKEPSIVTVEQGRGASTLVKAKNYGTATLVATDSVAGCSIDILIEVI